MAILGIILIVAGAVSVLYGIMQNNSLEAQLTSLFSSGKTNPGTIWIVIGIIAVVVGIVLMVLNSKKNSSR